MSRFFAAMIRVMLFDLRKSAGSAGLQTRIWNIQPAGASHVGPSEALVTHTSAHIDERC